MNSKTIRGHGILKADELETPVSYRIVTRISRGMKSADGIIDGDPAKILAAMNSKNGMQKLELSNGEAIDVIVTRWDGTSTSEIAVSGPIPNY